MEEQNYLGKTPNDNGNYLSSRYLDGSHPYWLCEPKHNLYFLGDLLV